MHQIRKSSRIVLVLTLVLATCAVGQALTLYSGQDRFDVRVTNRSFKTIDMARGNVWVSGNQARITVQADGYRDGSTYVYMNANSHSYSCSVQLDDPSVNIRIKDDSGLYISGAYSDSYSQSLYWGDEFGIKGSLPVAGFEDLTERQLDVRVNYGFAFGARKYLYKSGNTWRFEVVIKRRDMNGMFVNIDIICPKTLPTEPTPPSDAVEPIADLIADVQANEALLPRLTALADVETVHGRLDSLNRRIRQAFAALDDGERRSILETLRNSGSKTAHDLHNMATFEELHR